MVISRRRRRQPCLTRCRAVQWHTKAVLNRLRKFRLLCVNKKHTDHFAIGGPMGSA